MKTNTNASPGESDTQSLRISRKTLWIGRILSALPVLFLLMDGIMKLAKPEPVVKATIALGYPDGVIMPLGIILLVSVIVYVIPRTAILGAILLTGYFGGAIAAQVRVGAPLLTHILFPVYLAALIWGGLLLREPRLHVLIPVRRERQGFHSWLHTRLVVQPLKLPRQKR